jgi:hypothetical protein
MKVNTYMKSVMQVKVFLELSRIFFYKAGPYQAKCIQEFWVHYGGVLLWVHHCDFTTINLDNNQYPVEPVYIYIIEMLHVSSYSLKV